tara:strand:- start:526 stop:801 length:276 start_codon:yes stop_codon:yes gene_type:complete
MTAHTSNSVKKVTWKTSKDDSGEETIQLWDTFLQEYGVQGTIVPVYNKNMKKTGFKAQLWDRRPFKRRTLKGAKSWLETCYRAERFKMYNI